MKIRIKGNSVRYRLSKTDVRALATTGVLEDSTNFGPTMFRYALKAKEETDELSAIYQNDMITIFVPAIFLKDWPENEIVGINGKMSIGNEEMLSILIEKDFQCLDHTDEDQSDNYINPNKTC